MLQPVTRPLIRPICQSITGALGGGFSPISLFTGTDKGYIYDNNDYVNPASWRRNLLTYSEQFVAGTGTSITAGAATGIDGGQSASRYAKTDATTPRYQNIQSTMLVNANTTYTASRYFKYDGYDTTVSLEYNNTNNWGGVAWAALFNVTSAGVSVSSQNFCSASVADVGNGWYRATATFTTGATIAAPTNPATLVRITGASGVSVLMTAAQLEAGSVATDYQRITDFNSDFLAAYPNTTMFVDSAGTQPALVNGLVGLQLDKSGGLALGTEALPMPLDLTTWSLVGTLSATTADSFTNTSGAGAGRSRAVTTGRWYRATVSFTKSDSSTLFGMYDGSTAIPLGTSTESSGTLTATYLATGLFYLRLAGNASVTITSVSVKEIAGNHRYQTTTGSKPILRGTPVGGNIVTNGDFATDVSGWTNNGSGSFVFNSGKGRFTRTISTDSASQAITTVIGKVYRVTLNGTQISGNLPRFAIGPVNSITSGSNTIYSASVSPYNPTIYYTATATTTYLILGATADGAVVDFDDITLHDVSADAVTAPYGLQYDGIDDFLTTASVDFTATDKMAVVMGVRKLSDAATGFVAELSVDSSVNNGSFQIRAPNGAANNYLLGVRGSVAQALGTYTTYTAPISNVLTLLGDLGGSLFARINGSQNSITNGTGGGNYGNYVLYFGRRAGSSSPFNGLDFGGICVNKTLTASQLSSAERWTASRTGVVL
jgi:hypothetical protein